MAFFDDFEDKWTFFYSQKRPHDIVVNCYASDYDFVIIREKVYSNYDFVLIREKLVTCNQKNVLIWLPEIVQMLKCLQIWVVTSHFYCVKVHFQNYFIDLVNQC